MTSKKIHAGPLNVKMNCPRQTLTSGFCSQNSKLVTVTADLRDWKLMCLCPVDANGNVSVGGAQFLVEPAVGADPQVILCDLHLENKQCNNQPQRRFTVQKDRIQIPSSYLLHRGNPSQAWSLNPATAWWWRSCSPSQMTGRTQQTSQ